MRIMLSPDQIEKLIKGKTIKIKKGAAWGSKEVEIAFSDIGYQRIIDIAQKGLKEING